MFSLAREPQSIGKLLDSGFRLFIAGFKPAVVFAFVMALVSAAPRFLLPWFARGEAPPDPGAAFLSLGVMMVATLLVSALVIGALIYVYGHVGAGREVTLGKAFGAAVDRLPTLIGAMVLYMLAVMLGLILLIIPGLILMLSLMLYSPIVMLEKERAYAALRKSHRLVWGNWWRSAIVLTVPFVIFIVVGAIIGTLAIVAFGIGAVAGDPANADPTVLLISTLFEVLGNTIGIPLLTAVTVVLYNDLRLRKQGGDLAQRMQAQAAPQRA